MSNGSGDSSQADQLRKKKRRCLCEDLMLILNSLIKTYFLYSHNILMTVQKGKRNEGNMKIYIHVFKDYSTLFSVSSQYTTL